MPKNNASNFLIALDMTLMGWLGSKTSTNINKQTKANNNNDYIHVCACIHFITKTRLYKFDPLKAHFYTVKLGFTVLYIISLFLLKNIDFRYSLEPPLRDGSNEYPQSIFGQK